MQTVVLDIQDSFIKEFLGMIEKFQDKVQIKKDKNLEYDPYFYERQQQLRDDLEEIDSGKVTMLSPEQYEETMDNFFSELKSKYAH